MIRQALETVVERLSQTCQLDIRPFPSNRELPGIINTRLFPGKDLVDITIKEQTPMANARSFCFLNPLLSNLKT